MKKLAVIGPNAAEARLGGGGSASVSPFYSVSPLEGIKNYCGADTEIIFEEGAGLNGNFKIVESKYLVHDSNGKMAQGLKAEYFSNPGLEGTPAVTTVDEIIDFSWGWANPKPGITKGSYSVRWSGRLLPPETGKYKIGVSASSGGFRLYLDGSLVIDEWEEKTTENFEASLASVNKTIEVALTKNVSVPVQVEFYKRANRNFIRFEWEVPGQNPLELAKKAAGESDAVVIFAGLSNFFEGGNNDRSDLLLPGGQNLLIREVAKINPNTVVVLINGSPVAMPWLDEVDAVLEAYYPGQEGGNAIARVLFGEVNPSGKLPETFPVKLSDNPAWGNYPGENNTVNYSEGIFVGYRHYDTKNIEPLFPFGHGLSYTTFGYSDLKTEKAGDGFVTSFQVENTGDLDGAEIVQLYIRDVKASEPRPFKELKNFKKIFLKAGEKKKVAFKIDDRDLSFFSAGQNRWMVEPGEFEILIGSSSKDIRLNGIFNCEEEYIDEVFFEDFDHVDNKIWRVAGWTEHGGKTSPERCYAKDGFLNMIFINDPDEGNLGSAIQTEVEFFYGRWEARLKPSNVPGVLNSFYTIDWDNTADPSADNDGTKQEIDIEFLTKSFMGSSGEVHIALHARGRESFGSQPDISLDFDPSAEFHTWGFDITPDYIEWFVDDKIIHRYVYEDNDIAIDSPYMLKLNSWSGKRWVGGPPEENVECVYQIDWIKFTPLRLLEESDFNKTPLTR